MANILLLRSTTQSRGIFIRQALRIGLFITLYVEFFPHILKENLSLIPIRVEKIRGRIEL